MDTDSRVQWYRIFNVALADVWIETIFEAVSVASAADLSISQSMSDAQVSDSIRVYAIFNVALCRDAALALKSSRISV